MADEQSQVSPTGLEQAQPSETMAAGAPAQEQAQASEMPNALGGINTEQKAEEAQEAPAPAGAPENYEPFKFGENPAIDPSSIEGFSTAAKEAGLSQEQAQKVLDSLAPSVAAKLRGDLIAQAGQWLKASQADPEFGGASFEANKGIAVGAYQKLATPELREILNNSGLCNHPEVIRLFYRIGKMTSQDSGVTGAPVPRQKGLEALYPNSPMRW